MSRAILVLAVLAVLCVLVSASPAKEMEKMLNTVQNGLYTTPLQDALKNADVQAAEKLADAVDAFKTGAVMDLDAEEHSFAQQSAEAGAGIGMGHAAAASASAGSSRPGKPMKLKSLQLTTGPSGEPNSQCFACQYYVQRTLGAMLGPYYAPNAAGAPAPAHNPVLGYVDTATPKIAWARPSAVSAASVTLGPARKAPPKKLILAETGADMEDVSFLEIASYIKEAFPVPSSEEAMEQYAKWEPYLSMIEVDAEDMAEVDEEAEEEVEKKVKKATKAKKPVSKKVTKKAKKAVKAKKVKKNLKKSIRTVKRAHKKLLSAAREAVGGASSVRSKHGPFYGKKDFHAARTFFAQLCHRRTPAEFMPVCRALWKKLPQIVEELTVGDRPDEICVRHQLCSESSYVVKRAHTAIRPSG